MEQRRIMITGASSGFGLEIAIEALKRGHTVVGTARNIAKAKSQASQLEAIGMIWLQLDVTASDAYDVVHSAVLKHDIDLLVNNAGYGLYGVFEDMSEMEIRQQFDTNVFGGMRVIQAAIPHFRRKRRGTIVNIGSISGLTARNPGGIMYSASKFAMEGLTEGLAVQLKPFNVRVLLVEPSFFRTNWLVGGFITPTKEMTKDYVDGPIDKFLTAYPQQHGKQQGDPVKAAKLIIDVATEVGVGADEEVKKCLRLPLGNDAIEFGREYLEKLKHDFDTTEKIARSADFDQE